MADVVKELAVKFVADMSGLNAGLARMDDAVEASTKRIKDKYGSLLNHMQTIGSRMTYAITLPLIGAGAAALKFAADAQESESLFEVSMGNMAASARKWSQDTSKALGLNSYEVRKNIGTFNVMLNSMGLAEEKAYDMSKGMTQLAYDMASFYNLSNEEAFDKLRSGISGEMESLKRLGILVDEETVKQYAYANGIANTGDKLTQQQKIMARYGSIMEQTSKAQGDLERTGGSLTNQIKRLQNSAAEVAVEFGKILIPAAQRVVSILVRAAEWFKTLDDGQRKAAIGAAVFAASLGPVMLGIAKAITGFAALKAAVESFGWTMKSTFIAGGYVTAILALVAALGALVKQMYDVTKGAEKMAEAQWRASQQQAMDEGYINPEALKRTALQKFPMFGGPRAVAAMTDEQVNDLVQAYPEVQRKWKAIYQDEMKKRREAKKAIDREYSNSIGQDTKDIAVKAVKIPKIKVFTGGGGSQAKDLSNAWRESEIEAGQTMMLEQAMRGQSEAYQTYLRAQAEYNRTVRELGEASKRGEDTANRTALAWNRYNAARQALIQARKDEDAATDKAKRAAQIKAYGENTEIMKMLSDLEVQQLENSGKKLEAAYKRAGAEYVNTIRGYAQARAEGTLTAEKEHILSDIAEGTYKATTQAAYRAATAEADAARAAEEQKRKAAVAQTRQLAGQVYERVQVARRGYNEMVKDAWEAAKKMAEASRGAVQFVSGADIWRENQLRRTRGSRSYLVPEPGYLNENAPASQNELLKASQAMLVENQNQTAALDGMVRALGSMIEPLRAMAGEGAY